MIDGKKIGEIEDIQDRGDLLLITIDTNVQAIKEHIKQYIENESDEQFYKEWIEERVFGFFTKQDENGDYLEIYAFEGEIPNIEKTLYRMELSKSMCLMETDFTPTQAENAGLCWSCDNIPEYQCIKRRN